MTQPDTATPLIEVRKVSKHFGHVTALRDVDLELRPGEILGVVGSWAQLRRAARGGAARALFQLSRRT